MNRFTLTHENAGFKIKTGVEPEDRSCVKCAYFMEGHLKEADLVKDVVRTVPLTICLSPVAIAHAADNLLGGHHQPRPSEVPVPIEAVSPWCRGKFFYPKEEP